ncbi:RecX family transcriptional regulator [Candidatus Gracilibacteria bacterium]|nr:RecX family transcriptional regulator [Candidatus Gracilibacteria bacterium]
MQESKFYTYQRLKDYALWYYFRYYPSNARLLQKLQEKGSEEDAVELMKEIEHLTQETEIIKAKIDNYIFRNKNYRYIRQKMREKLFLSDDVEQYLEKFINSGTSLLTEDFLRKKIEMFIQKGKSRKYIEQKLGETKQDREVLTPLLEEYFINGELEIIKQEYEKIISKNPKLLDSGFSGKQKIIQKLLAKGFSYNEIKQIF